MIVQFQQPYSVDAICGNEEEGEIKVRCLDQGITQLQPAINKAEHYSVYSRSSEWAGWKFIVSDANGARVKEIPYVGASKKESRSAK